MATEGCGEKEICNLAVDSGGVKIIVQLANSGSFHDWKLSALFAVIQPGLVR